MNGIYNENLLHVLTFHDCIFSGDDCEYNRNGNRKNVIVNISNRENFLK